MKIGIIGIGSIGGTLARKLSKAGHEVTVANSKGAAAVAGFAAEIGATPADIYGAVNGMDAVILSIPLPAIAALPKDLFNAAVGSLPIIDTGNYYPGMRDPKIAEIDAGMPESVWVSEQLGRPVIKAFNNILAYSLAELGQPIGTPDRLAIAVAGDDAAAKDITMKIVNDTGFDPVDAGSIADSWRQQPSTPAYCCDYTAEQMRKGLAIAQKGIAEKKRDALPAMFAELGPNPTHDVLIAKLRGVNALD